MKKERLRKEDKGRRYVNGGERAEGWVGLRQWIVKGTDGIEKGTMRGIGYLIKGECTEVNYGGRWHWVEGTYKRVEAPGGWRGRMISEAVLFIVRESVPEVVNNTPWKSDLLIGVLNVL